MFAFTNKPDMGARLCSGFLDLSRKNGAHCDLPQLFQHLGGLLVETALVFETPDEALQTSLVRLSSLLGCPPKAPNDPALAGVLPRGHILDFETERGRQAARAFFEDWLDCAFEFHELVLSVTHNIIVALEDDGVARDESLALIAESATRAMAFEFAAQELCDVVIDSKISHEGWSLGDCVAALSAVAGRRLALSLNSESCEVFRGCDLPEKLDGVVHVMTQEATRLGVPAGSDWRFGLAANDMPLNAPVALVRGIEPDCMKFFQAIEQGSLYDQAVSCAKAAGRMLAVAAGGELPELEPVIAKPLAMSAMTETYKSVCMEYGVASC